MFQPGERVACINNEPGEYGFGRLLVLGAIYTIRNIEWNQGIPFVRVREMNLRSDQLLGARRFRALPISLSALLNTRSEKELVPDDPRSK